MGACLYTSYSKMCLGKDFISNLTSDFFFFFRSVQFKQAAKIINVVYKQ